MMKTIVAGIVAFFFAGAALAQNNTPNGSQANVPVPGGGAGTGTVTGGPFTVGDLIVGAGGQAIQDSAGAPAAQRLLAPSSAPTTPCSTSVFTSAFYPTCDLSKAGIAQGTNITGALTLGNPTATYQTNPSLALHWNYGVNNSGVNSSTTNTGPGRTNWAMDYGKVDQLGQGDAGWKFCDIFVNGAKVGASGAFGFLANPAGFCLGGQLNAGQAGVFLQGIGDIDFNDNGFDVAAIASNFNMKRTNSTGALGATWLGYRVNFSGSAPGDGAFTCAGLVNGCVDTTGATLGANAAAFTAKATQRFYLAATAGNFFPSAVGTDYFDSPVAGQFEFVFGGTQRLNFGATANIWALNGTLNMTNGNLLIATNSVIGMRSSNTPLSSPANAVFHIGSLDSATPVAQTLGIQGAAGSNISGSQFTIAGSVSTGTGTAGDIHIQTAGTGAGAAVQNTLIDAIVIKGANQSIQLPALVTGTPTASLCVDVGGNIIKKTTAGSCV